MKKVVYTSIELKALKDFWYEGDIRGYKIQAKIFDEPSQFGIDNGRISKLWISGNGEELNYDRGWDTPEPLPDLDNYSERLLDIYIDIIDNYN